MTTDSGSHFHGTTAIDTAIGDLQARVSKLENPAPLVTSRDIAPTVPAILAAMADNTLDQALILDGTIGPLGVLPGIVRTKPIVIRPKNAGMVKVDGALSNSPFAYWGYNGFRQNGIALQGLSYVNFRPIQTGVHWLGDCDRIDLSDSSIVFAGGDTVIAGNHFLYLSSYNLKGPTNCSADRVTVDATNRTANALHAYHDPGFSNFHAYNWTVRNCNKALLLWSGSGIDVAGWVIDSCNQPADITVSGKASNMKATNCTTPASVAAACVQSGNSW